VWIERLLHLETQQKIERTKWNNLDSLWTRRTEKISPVPSENNKNVTKTGQVAQSDLSFPAPFSLD